MDVAVAADNQTPRKMVDNGDGSHTPYVVIDGGGGGGGGGDVNLDEVGGVPFALGQAAMAGSLPVVLASDQPAIPVKTSVLELNSLSAGAVNADLVPATDIGLYSSFAIKIVGSFSGTLTFQQDNDPNFSNPVNLIVQADVVNNNPITSTTTAGVYRGNKVCRYIRVRMTSWASGAATGIAEFYPFSNMPYSSIPVGQQGAWAVTSTPATATAATLTSAATTNATSVKTSAGSLYEVSADNFTASTKWLKLYNKASAPTVGTDVPILTIPIPANSSIAIPFGELGKRFATGIAFAITGAQAVTDTTAVAAGDVHVSMSYI